MNFSRAGKSLSAFLEPVKQSLAALAGWIFRYSLGLMIRRDPGLTVVIGRPGPVFADNSKYFYIWAQQHALAHERFVFLTDDRVLHVELVSAGGDSIYHPSLRSICVLARCGNLVTDMAAWSERGIYQLTRGARIMQIWHGAPLKHIELDVFNARLKSMSCWVKNILLAQKAFVGRYPRYNAVVSTSRYFVNAVFANSFRADHYIPAGYPRNDVLLKNGAQTVSPHGLSKINVDHSALEALDIARSKGLLVALYVPTFRQDMSAPFERSLNFSRLSTFASQNNLLLIVKLHPVMHGRYQLSHYSNILEYEPFGDVYPLMAECDILITDYSSIFFDFLLLDRPVVFFIPDITIYVSQDRSMYFPFDSMAPGTECRNQDELEACLFTIVQRKGQDDFSMQRAVVRELTHDYVDDQSAARLLDWLRN